ncbi:MAG: HIT family protein [Defluviitaleaceae bacterium]|nr:HIT family protein [Defluviitaleaceae bacterium]
MENLKETVFYKIIHGQLPAYKIYEDDDFLVIMDRYPNNLGHCLILPKIPARDIFDLNDNCAARLYPLAKKIASAVMDATGCDGINIIQNNSKAAGQVIFYFHLHIVPRYHEDDMRIVSHQKDFATEKFEDMAEKLKRGLQ